MSGLKIDHEVEDWNDVSDIISNISRIVDRQICKIIDQKTKKCFSGFDEYKLVIAHFLVAEIIDPKSSG